MVKKEFFTEKNIDYVQEAWLEKAQDRMRYSKNTWIEFAISTARNSSVFSLIYRFTSFIRRITFISTVITILRVIFIALSTSAFFVFLIAGTIAMLPFAVICAIFASVHTIVSFRYYDKLFKKRLYGKTLYLFFPSKEDTIDQNLCLSHYTKALSHKKAVVIIVSPYYFSSKGIGGKGIFMTCRREAENIYIIRRRYFFIFKRKILNKRNSDTFLIY